MGRRYVRGALWSSSRSDARVDRDRGSRALVGARDCRDVLTRSAPGWRVLTVALAALSLIPLGAVDARADTPGPVVFRPAAAVDAVPGPIPDDITAVACSPGSLCVAVGNGNSLLTSTDAFGAWRVSSGQFPVLQSVQAVSCPSDTLCIAIENGSVDTSTDPIGGASTWTQKTGVVTSGHFTGVSCPTTTLCVAVTSDGKVVSSADPASGGTAVWTTVSLGGQLAGVSCASSTACVAVGQPSSGTGGLIYSTTTPTTTSTAGWTPTAVSAPVQGATCPSSALCIGYENTGVSPSATGAITVSTNPVAGNPTWSAPATLVSGGWIDGVSCASPAQCVAVDSLGDVHATTNPGGGVPAWNSATLMSPLPIGAVTCVSGPFCVLTGGVNGQIWTTSDPTLGGSSWSRADTAVPLYGVSCPSEALCAAVDDIGNVLTSTNPSSASPSVSVTQATGAALLAIACPNASLCVATDISGDVVTSTNPTGPATAWTTTNIDGSDAINGVSCPSAGVCAAVDDAGNVLTATNPASGPWTPQNIDGATPINGISCPSASFCVAVDDSGNVLVSTNPTGGAGAWQTRSVDHAGPLFGIACPSSGLCVAVDGVGNVIASTDPTGPAQAWSISQVDNAPLNAVSCPSTTMCVAVDGFGFEVNSINPAGGANEWTGSGITGAPLFGVSCPDTSGCAAVDGNGSAAWGGPTPSNLTPPSITGQATQGSQLMEVHGTWLLSPTQYSLQWERCNSSGASCSDISGATGSSYILTAADVGSTVRVLELASNANGDGATVESRQTAVIQALPPTSSSATGPPPSSGGPVPPATPAGGVGTVIIKGITTSGTNAKSAVSCTGSAGATCSMTLKLTVNETIKQGKVIAVTASAKSKKKVVVLGTTTVTLGAGQSKIVTVSLNPAGKRLLAQRHTLKVSLAITQSTRPIFRTTITFKIQSKKKH